MSNPMIDLFQSELKGYLEHFESNRQLSESVQAAAMLAGLDQLSELADRMTTIDDPDTIEQWLSLLREMKSGDPETILATRSDVVTAITEHLTSEQKVVEKDIALDQDMMGLFRIELETHSKALSDGILKMEQNPEMSCGSLMRAAHSIKGAARIAGQDDLVKLAHAIEDYFSLIIERNCRFNTEDTDLLLHAVDAFLIPERMQEYTEEVRALTSSIEARVTSDSSECSKPKEIEEEETESVVRVTAEKLDRLLKASGQAMVETRQGEGIAGMIMTMKNHFIRLGGFVSELERKHLLSNEIRKRCHEDMQHASKDINRLIVAFEQYFSEISVHTETLYDELVGIRMRPFEDGLAGFPRMVREVARSLNKKVRFEIEGKLTEVDRDILQLLEAPLTHLVRNAIDHGIEPPEDRAKACKDEIGTIVVSASHQAGKLRIELRDDGRGIEIDRIRMKAIERGLISEELMAGLSEREILDFMFLPGFTTRDEVSETSGRGVGMDVVQTMVRTVGGEIGVESEPGSGTTFFLLLPLTLSVVRMLLAEIDGTIFGFPLNRIQRIVDSDDMEEGIRPVSGAKVLLGREGAVINAGKAIIIKTANESVGLIVDRLIVERDVLVTPLDRRLGKVQNIAATTITRHSEAAFIVDMDDLIHSIEGMRSPSRAGRDTKSARILVVEDSITVREMERRVLEESGYHVEVATDGMEGWNMLRSGNFDLVVTDIDMPRMNGYELVGQIRRDPVRNWLPVVIVSYKDREEDRRKGIQAGANRFLNKGAFEDKAFLDTIKQLLDGAR